MVESKTFIVYFEIFGIKKKFTVIKSEVNSQQEAEDYVRFILIPDNIKFYDSINFIKSKKIEDKDIFENFNEIFENFNKNFNDFFKKK